MKQPVQVDLAYFNMSKESCICIIYTPSCKEN